MLTLNLRSELEAAIIEQANVNGLSVEEFLLRLIEVELSLLDTKAREGSKTEVRATGIGSSPEWLKASWESAKRMGLDKLSMEDINDEIDAARKERRPS